MKFILFLFLAAIQKHGYSQDVQEPLLISTHLKDSLLVEIQLSKTLNESRMGVWKNGDFEMCIEIQPLEESFRNDYVSLMNAMENQYKNDSVASSRCKIYAERYLIAANQLKEAENRFDLRSLIVYVGPDNEEQNKGSSSTVDMFIRRRVENGDAAVYYHGERIYTLKKQVLSDYIMSNIKIYYDLLNNCAYNYIGHINW